MTQTNVAKIARSSLWLTASFILAKFSQFISQIFLARLLSPKDFGVWGMVLIVTTLSALFKEYAIASVLVQRGIDDKKRVDAVYSLGINISVGMFILQALIGYPLSRFFGIPMLWPLTACAALIFVIGAGAGVRDAILQRQMKFREVAICEASMGVARLSGAVIWASLGGGVWSFVVGELCMELANAICSRLLCRYPFKYHLIPDGEAVRDVRGYITSLIGINLAVYANTNSDNFIVGKLLGATSLGFYGVAYQLAMLPTFALSQINRVSFSVLSQRDNLGQKTFVCQLLEFYAIFYAPVYGLGFIVAPWLIPTLYGSVWKSAVIVFQTVLVFAYARGFMAILGTALNAMNKPSINAAINWVLVPISIPAFYVGAKLSGTTGVAIAAALVMGVGATFWFWITTSQAARWPLSTLVMPAIIPTVTILAAIAGVTWLPLPENLSAILQPFLLILIYAAGVSLLSKGRIPKQLIALARRSLKSKTLEVP